MSRHGASVGLVVMITTSATAERPKGVRVTACIATGAFCAMMLASGLWFLRGPDNVVRSLRALGYPDYLRTFLGIAKLAGVAALAAPRTPRALREWAYAGFAFDLVGALVSHMSVGATAAEVAPVVLALALLFASYGLRRLVATRGGGEMRSIWVARVVLLVAAGLFVRIGLAYVIDPRGAAGANHVVLAANGAVTAMRVMGALFVAVAGLLLASWPTRRLLGGLAILSTIAVAVLAMRVFGLVVDGPDPFTTRVLKPEIVLVAVSSLALVIERRSRRLPRMDRPRGSRAMTSPKASPAACSRPLLRANHWSSPDRRRSTSPRSRHSWARTGIRITRRVIAPEAYVQKLVERGFPEVLARTLASGFASRAAGELAEVVPTLRALVQRPLRTVEQE
jgi:hypothetical protein